MNNKGFTLIEVLASLVIFTIASLVISRFVGNTLAISKKDSYNLMKNNIISTSEDFLKECDAKTINCNLSWKDNRTTFSAELLEGSGYFKNLKSPIDNKYLGKCLKIDAVKDNGTYHISLIDNCY